MCRRRILTQSVRRRIVRLFQIVLVLAVVFGFKRITRQQDTTYTSIKGASKLSKDVSQLQEDIDYLATTITVYFTFLSKYTAEINFIYNGSRTINLTSGWGIYVSTELGFRPLKDSLNEERIIVRHVNGFLHKFQPATGYFPISPGESLRCKIKLINYDFKLHTRFLVSPNWYIAAKGLTPRTITSTADQQLSFVSFPDTPHDSSFAEPTPDLGNAPLIAVIPTPKELITGQTSNGKSRKVSVSEEWTVYAEDHLQNERNFLSDKLGLKASSSSDAKSKAILLTLVPTSGQSPFLSDESYDLKVDHSKEVIAITGKAPAGVFYGAQTLMALINDKGEVPEVLIKDFPRFSYRGLMVDVARNFQPKHEIFKLLDIMAMYKMNKFHFHMSDSQGWRLEIPGLEELTSVGAKRCHDLQEKTCILSQLGSGPDTSTSGTGYYSTEDYREILRHAKERHIQVIPEFDFPGHSHAAIKSMIARHDRLAQEGRNSQSFLLNDFEDKSQYFTVHGFYDDAINPCISSTYEFLHYLLLTLTRLHSDIQPLTFFHFGGDEVPRGVWVDSPACETISHTLGKDASLIKKYWMEHFVRKLSNITKEYGLDIGGWSDAFVSGRDVLSRETQLNNKNTVAYLWGDKKQYGQAIALMEIGYKVVLAPSHVLYLDHSSEPSFDERGLNWAAAYSNSRKIFGYSPPEHQNILGIEGALWSELIHTADQMHGMLFPRLLAVAERAWHKRSWIDLGRPERVQAIADDWVKFANRVGYSELGRLDKMGVAYHVPTPIARVICTDKCNKLHVTTELPGLKIEFSTDGGLTWNDVTPETEVNGKIKLRTRSADQNRFSRVIEFEHF